MRAQTTRPISTTLLAVPSILSRYRAEIEAELRSVVEACPRAFSAQVRYHMGWVDEQGRPSDGGGKGLRPALLLLACEGLGSDREQGLPLAAAIELVHNFSLVHDDVQDGDRERRHRPTAWVLWGVPQAVNLGDALFALAMSAVSRAGERCLPPLRVLGAHRALTEACLEMIEGQDVDLSLEEEESVSLSQYLLMAERKTGALMGCSLELGALAADGTDAQAALLRRAGRALGLAFQARDDCLAVWGERSQTGKAVGNDILRRKKSLPVVHGLSLDGPQAAELRRIYSKGALSPEDVELVRHLLTALGARAFARRLAEERCQAALLDLDSAGMAAWAQREFRLLVDYLLETQGA